MGMKGMTRNPMYLVTECMIQCNKSFQGPQTVRPQEYLVRPLS